MVTNHQCLRVNKVFVHIILALCVQSGLAQRTNFTISGQLAGLDNQYVYLNYLPGNARGVYDSAYVKTGRFRFNGHITSPGVAHLLLRPMDIPPDTSVLFDFYLEPADIVISGNSGALQATRVKGSASHADWQTWMRRRAPVFNRIQQWMTSRDNFGNKKPNRSLDSIGHRESPSLFAALEAKINAATDTLNSIDALFVRSHPASYVSLEILSRASVETMPFTVYKQLYGGLSNRLKASEKGFDIKHRIILEESLKIGSFLRDFTATDQNSNSISLQNYRSSKYVLLDFGASWCAPCRELVPVLKELYSKYQRSLEIIGISIQDKKEDWSSYVLQQPTEWPQVREPITRNGGGKLVSFATYCGIDRIPALLLLDESGKIVGKYGSLFYNSPTAYMKQLSVDIARILGTGKQGSR